MREGWEYKKLGDFITEYSVKNRCNETIPVYSVTNSQGFCKDYFSKEVASQDKSTYKIVPYGCFAYNPSRINVGSVDWQNKEERVIVSPLYNVFSVSENLNQDFLLYFLKSNGTMGIINTLATGTVRLNLKLSMLKEFSIIVPPLSDQQSIVEELNTINELIRLKREQLKDYDNLAQSIFYEMFGDEKYERRKLKNIVKVKSGQVSPLEDPYCDMVHVGPANIESNTGRLINLKTAKEENLISGKYLFDSSMVLYSKIRPNLNKVTIADFEGICSADMYPLIPSKSIDKKFLLFILKQKEFLSYAIANSGRANIPKINREALLEYSTILPPLSLQLQFAERLALIEQQKAEIQSTIADLETLSLHPECSIGLTKKDKS